MSETAMWTSLRSVMKSLDPVRVENLLGEGTPDVNFTHGWMELKYLPEWPVRPTTDVKVDHFTREQRLWLLRRALKKGKTFLMLKVGESEWLLFDGIVAARVVGNVPRQKLYHASIARWDRKPKPEELIPCLTR